MRVDTFCCGVDGAWIGAPPSRTLDGPDTLALWFGSRETLEPGRGFEALAARYPRALVTGCSTAGQILGREIQDERPCGAVIAFERTALRSAAAAVGWAGSSFSAGASLARELSGPELCSVLVLSDGIQVNGSELARGMVSALPPGVLVTGGLAADGSRFESTRVLHQGRAVTQEVVAIGFYGTALQIGCGSRGGWDIFGPVRRITRAAGNILFELDGRPALTLYREYLGERASGLPSTGLLFPLSISPIDGSCEPLVRTILAIDEQAGSLTFAGDMPQGWTAQLMRANLDRLIDGAAVAAGECRLPSQPESPEFALAVSCVGRRLVLGERAEEEVEAVADQLGPDCALVGFYSYGELSPAAGGACALHNQTMTLTTWQEAVR